MDAFAEKKAVTPRPIKSSVPDKQLNKDAVLLVQAINADLAAGTRHYNKKNELVSSLGDILQCLLDEEGIRLEPAEVVLAQAAAGD